MSSTFSANVPQDTPDIQQLAAEIEADRQQVAANLSAAEQARSDVIAAAAQALTDIDAAEQDARDEINSQEADVLSIAAQAIADINAAEKDAIKHVQNRQYDGLADDGRVSAGIPTYTVFLGERHGAPGLNEGRFLNDPADAMTTARALAADAPAGITVDLLVGRQPDGTPYAAGTGDAAVFFETYVSPGSYTSDPIDSEIRVISEIDRQASVDGTCDLKFQDVGGGTIRPWIRFGGALAAFGTLSGDTGGSGDWTRNATGWYSEDPGIPVPYEYGGTVNILDTVAQEFRSVSVAVLDTGDVWVFAYDGNGSARADIQGITPSDAPDVRYTTILRARP